MSEVRKALRGLSNFSIFPVISNTNAAYSVGAKIPIEGVQEFTTQKQVDDWKIYGDDGIFEWGVDFKSSNFTLQFAGLSNELRKYFEGGAYDEQTLEYTFSSNSAAPELAFSFASALSSNTKELTKVYCAKCTKVSFEHKTKGEGNSIVPIKIEGVITERKVDKAVFTKVESVGNNILWLDTIDSVPEA